MAKGIVVVDMPDKCCNCTMGFVNEYYDQFECYFKPGAEIKPDGEKPDWCPIKELPKGLEEINCPHSMSDYQRKGFSRGFNACLDKLEGKD